KNACRDSAGVQVQAERAGFEPAEGFYPLAALAKRCFRPLSHLSKVFFSSFCVTFPFSCPSCFTTSLYYSAASRRLFPDAKLPPAVSGHRERRHPWMRGVPHVQVYRIEPAPQSPQEPVEAETLSELPAGRAPVREVSETHRRQTLLLRPLGAPAERRTGPRR